MIFRQMFDKESSTYTYLMASRNGGEALLLDPVLEQTGRYLNPHSPSNLIFECL